MRKILPATFIWLLLQAAAAEMPDPVNMIVFPLDAGPEAGELSWLSEGIALSISGQIDGHNVRSLSRKERIAAVENMDLPPGASLSRASVIGVSQRLQADKVVLGKFSGGESSLKISVRVLDLKAMKYSGEMAANGPLSALPEMENELAWLILGNIGLKQDSSREAFVQRMRRTSNGAYALYVQSLDAPVEEEKLRLLLRAVAAYRDFPQAHLQIGRIYFGRGDCGNAMPHLFAGLRAENAVPENDFMRGTCHLIQGSHDQAIEILEGAAKASVSLHVLGNLGVAHLRKGDLDRAANVLREAWDLAPTDSTVSMNLSIAGHRQGDSRMACNVLQGAIKAHPKNGMLQFLLGYFLKELGEQEGAAAAMEKARGLGISVEKLLQENPLSWTRVSTAWP